MRILFVLDGVFMGGAERNTLQLMRELTGRGHQCILCTLGGRASDRLLTDSGLDLSHVHCLDAGRVYDLRAAWRFLKLVRRLQPDCIHAEDPYANIPVLAARIIGGVPAVMTRHINAGAGSAIWERLRSFILHKAGRLAYDRAIVVSEALRPLFSRQYGLPPERTVTIHNGVELHRFQPGKRDALRSSYGWAPETPIILMVAVLRRGKGHDAMLAAMPTVLQARPEARLLIVGDGPLRANIEHGAQGLGSSVVLMGERHDIADLMVAADLVVLPSESEALPTVLLEAAAAGTPVVASGVGGVGEIVDDGATGLIVPVHDPESLAEAVTRVLTDKDRKNRMGLAARVKAQSAFSITHQADKTLALYQEITGRV